MKVYILHRSIDGFITYIPENHFHLIRARAEKGRLILSLVYPFSREQLAQILTANPETDLEEI